MLQKLRERRQEGEKGFTLIELMVVVLIIAILIAIAVPAFLGARKRASERGQQANLRNALGTQETLFTDDQEYTTDLTVLKAEEPSLEWLDNSDDLDGKGNKVASYVFESTADVDDQQLVLVARSNTNKCFYIAKDAAAGTRYKTVTITGNAECTVPTRQATASAFTTFYDKSSF